MKTNKTQACSVKICNKSISKADDTALFAIGLLIGLRMNFKAKEMLR